MELKVFFGVDGTRGLPRWWYGDPYLISASALWDKKRGRFRVLRKRLQGEFFLDSGGFSFFSKQGEYPFTPDEYLRYVNIIKPDYFATMDYPCEVDVNRDVYKTNRERIEATVDYGIYIWKNRDKVDSKIVVVIQGFTLEEYEYCYHLYRKRGVNADYWAFGTMCRRWKDEEIRRYINFFRKMVGDEAKIHIFGIKISSLNCDVIKKIDSIDTMAWCYAKFTGGYGCNEINFKKYKTKLNILLKRCKQHKHQKLLFGEV